jgi:4-amino-4-deoxy-L-arabinose transferase-like glycosyltransferase
MRAPDLLDRLSAGWRAYVFIALLAFAAGVPGIVRVPPLDRDESRFAQASLQMLETGDFVRIAVQDQPRNKKPAGIHWLQAASVSLFSSPQAHAIWAYRLPSLLGALLAALATLWGGSALLGRRAAFAGACLFAVSLLLSTEALIAKTDAALCGFTTLAMAALAHLRAGNQSKGIALLFWATFGIGVLIKGPVTVIVAAGALAALFFWEQRAAWMKPLASWPGPLLALAIVSPWAIAIGIETNGKFFADAIGGDLAPKFGGGDEGHAGLPGFHALLVWLLLFPATIALPAALLRMWRAIRAPRLADDHGATRFLIAWALPVWLVFELLPTKLPHYVLPAYPALALLCGAALVDVFEQDAKRMRAAARIIALLGAVILVAACAYLSTLMFGDAEATQRRALQAALVGAPLLLVGAIFIWRAKGPMQIVLTACAALIVFNWSARDRILPEARPYLVSAEASNALMRAGLHPRLSPGAQRLVSVGFNEPSFVFLTRTDTFLGEGPLASSAAIAGEGALVEARQAQAFNAGLAARGLAFAPIGAPVVGFNYSNGDDVLLQPGRIISVPAAVLRSP